MDHRGGTDEQHVLGKLHGVERRPVQLGLERHERIEFIHREYFCAGP